jgi:L-aminopeptidase/D-esterase-like protein
VITELPGVWAGHWTDPVGLTGCTVVLFPEGTVASGEVRGGAPATRETALLAPERLVDRVDAVVLSGGSAYGLAAADGVMRFCEEQGSGFPTSAGVVPIVVGLSLYDLNVGDPKARPGADQGYAACRAASADPMALGRVGAGTGATVGTWAGADAALPGGLGGAVQRQGALVVAALMAVNASGWVDDGEQAPRPGAGGLTTNTTIGVVATNARLDKVGCHLLAQSAHDGLARALVPAHTRFDGDAIVAASVGPDEARVEAQVDHVRWLAMTTVEQAVRAVGG